MENVSMKTKLEYGWVVENIKHLLNDWSQGKPLILYPIQRKQNYRFPEDPVYKRFV